MFGQIDAGYWSAEFIDHDEMEITEPDEQCVPDQEDDLRWFLDEMNKHMGHALKQCPVLDAAGTSANYVELGVRDFKLFITIWFEQPYAEPNKPVIEYIRRQLGFVIAHARKSHMRSIPEDDSDDDDNLMHRIKQISRIVKQRGRLRVSHRNRTLLLAE